MMQKYEKRATKQKNSLFFLPSLMFFRTFADETKQSDEIK